MDLQGLTDINPQRFWQRVLKNMIRSTCDENLVPRIEKLITQETLDLFDLEDLFQESMDKGYCTVLLMDEFEYVTGNPDFGSDFFGSLRTLAIHCGVALCYSEEIKGSPFFNIFANVVLHPFTYEDVDKLLSGYTQGEMSEEHRAFIWNLAGGHPLFIQIAGYYLFDGQANGLVGDALTRYVSGNFDQQASSHYIYLWSHCSDSEKTILLILLALSLQILPQKSHPVLDDIVRLRPRSSMDLSAVSRRGMVREQSGAYALFSESLARWMRLEILAPADGQENQRTAGEWLKSMSH